MNQNTRQRIVGTLVLVVAALVLLPVIFDGDGSYQPPVQTRIPPTPPQPQVEREFPQRPVITADTDAIRVLPESTEPLEDTPEPIADDLPPSATPATAAAERPSTPPEPAPEPEPVPEPPAAPSVAAEPAPEPPALDPSGLPQGWSVRLGAFASTSNATNLVARLQEAGHRAYTRQVDSSQGVLTAVFVGPLVDRAAAQQMMENMRQEFQLNGLIVRYEIEE